MGSLCLWGHSIQEIGGDVVIGHSIYGVVVIDGSLCSRFYGSIIWAQDMASKLHPIFMFSKFCQHSKLCSSKTNGGVTPTNAITGISRLSTFIWCKSELPSSSRFGGNYNCSKYLPPGHVYHPCLTRSCCEVMTPQCYRDTGGVELHLNYLWTKYHAPTGFSFCGRTGRKTLREPSPHWSRNVY